MIMNQNWLLTCSLTAGLPPRLRVCPSLSSAGARSRKSPAECEAQLSKERPPLTELTFPPPWRSIH